MGDTANELFSRSRDPFADRNAARPGGGPKFPPLDPEEAEPLKAQLLNKGMSALSYLGGSLDKAFGGRAIRGGLAGKGRELLSAIPFSDTLGITNPEDSVSGDDLLTKHWKVMRENDPTRWEARDFAGPLLEMAIDPGSYINPFGAATKLGKLAGGLGHTAGMSRKALTQGFTHLEPALRALGHTDSTLAHLTDQGARIAPQSLLDAAAAKGIKAEAGTPLRGALGYGLPFRSNTDAIGTGKLAQSFAGLQDSTVKALKASPPIAHLRTLFDTDVMRSSHPGIADAAEHAGVPAREAVSSMTRHTERDLRVGMDAMMVNHQAIPGVENEVSRLLRGAAEHHTLPDAERVAHFVDPMAWHADLMRRAGTVIDPSTGETLAKGVADPAAVAAHVHANWNQIQAMASKVHDFGANVGDHAAQIGLSSKLVDHWADYAARRYIGAAPGILSTERGRLLGVQNASNIRRKSGLREIPGGTEQINEWAIQPALSGPKRTGDRATVAAHVYADMERNMMSARNGVPLDANQASSLRSKANEVAVFLEHVPEEHALHGIPYFNPDIVGDLAMRGQRHAKSVGAAEALLKGAVDMALPTANVPPNSGHVGLGDFLKKGGPAGLDTSLDLVPLATAERNAIRNAGFKDRQHAMTVLSDLSLATPEELIAAGKLHPDLAAKVPQVSWQGAGVEAYKKLAKHGFGPVDQVVNDATFPLIHKLNEFSIPGHDANAMSSFLNGWVTPTETQPFLGFMQGYQNLFKNMVYPIWPASHVRNASSAVWNNFLHGTGLEDYVDALNLLHKGHVADPAKYAMTHGMTPEQAAHALKNGAYADAKIGTGVSSFSENVGGRGLADEKLAAGLRGEERLVPRAPLNGGEQSVRDILLNRNALNPLAQAGLGGGPIDRLLRGSKAAVQHEDRFAPVALGRKVGTSIEDFVRTANYLGNLRQGMASPQSGALTRAIHFDYSDLTPAERNVAKNTIPFYTFMRKNLPYQIKMILNEPNKVSPLLHASGATDTHKPWTPEYLNEGLAIPIDQEDATGTQRYLTSFGLPIEEAASRFKFRNYTLPGGHQVAAPSPLAALMSFMGEANPLLKGPLEAMTDTQFKTGRKLSDLHSSGLAGGFGLIPEEYAQPLTQLLANSPLARITSSVNTAADPRKGLGIKALNLGTGLRFSDVDLDKQRAVVERDELNKALDADPRIRKFVNFYLDPEYKGPVPKALADLLSLSGTLKKETKAYHEKTKADDAKKKMVSRPF